MVALDLATIVKFPIEGALTSLEVPHQWTKVDEPIVYLDIKFPMAKP